jgi:hypothetical protein
MRRARISSDVPIIQRAILPVVFFQDGTLFRQVMEIAGDRSASVPARVVAFTALARIRNPHRSADYEGFRGGLDEHGVPRGGCGRGPMLHTPAPVAGPTPLPVDYLQRIDALRKRVQRDQAAPADVRSAAACT